MVEVMTVFANREDAGRKLMDLVAQYSHEIQLVLAIPRGGVEVAAVIARELEKPMGLISARKVGAPHNPELAIGAVAPDGSAWFNEELIHQLRLSPDQLENVRADAVQEMHRQHQAFGSEIELGEVSGKGVLIVDDGAAAGATLQACISVLADAGARPIGAAVPVAPIEVVSVMEDRTAFFLALETPTDFRAISEYYRDFSQVSDRRVQDLLAKTGTVL